MRRSAWCSWEIQLSRNLFEFGMHFIGRVPDCVNVPGQFRRPRPRPSSHQVAVDLRTVGIELRLQPLQSSKALIKRAVVQTSEIFAKCLVICLQCSESLFKRLFAIRKKREIAGAVVYAATPPVAADLTHLIDDLLNLLYRRHTVREVPMLTVRD